MGLDSIWQLPEGVEHPRVGKLNLSGGIMSGPNWNAETCTSFRGKVYSDFMEIVTGFSLYEESISGDELRSIARSLREFRDKLATLTPGYATLEYLDNLFGVREVNNPDGFTWGLQGLDDLINMFEVYSEIEGAQLRSWY